MPKLNMHYKALSSVFLIALLCLMMLSSIQVLAVGDTQPIHVQTTVKIALDKSSYGVGQTFRVNVTVEPPPPLSDEFFKEIQTFIRKPDGFLEMIEVSTNSKIYKNFTQNSIWFEYVPDEVGTWEVYAIYTGDLFADGITYLPSKSQTIDFSVTEYWNPQPTQILKRLSVISTTLILLDNGTSAVVSGKLTDVGPIGIANENVDLFYASSNDTSWTFIGSCKTDNDGKYSYQWLNPASGTYSLKAEWHGNRDFKEASNTLTLSSIPYENEQAMVQSNSTITQVKYNETAGLSFIVSGESGTTGYSRVIVPKSFMPEKENIRVLVDENEVSFDLSSDDTSWILTFTYQHSTHQVVIMAAIEKPSRTLPNVDNWILPAAVIVSVALIVALCIIVWLVKTRNK